MLRQATDSEKHLAHKLRSSLKWDEEDSYQVQLIDRDVCVFLARNLDGEVFEVEVRGNIDPGAWLEE